MLSTQHDDLQKSYLLLTKLTNTFTQIFFYSLYVNGGGEEVDNICDI
jgi:hypothetical protein